MKKKAVSYTVLSVPSDLASDLPDEMQQQYGSSSSLEETTTNASSPEGHSTRSGTTSTSTTTTNVVIGSSSSLSSGRKHATIAVSAPNHVLLKEIWGGSSDMAPPRKMVSLERQVRRSNEDTGSIHGSVHSSVHEYMDVEPSANQRTQAELDACEEVVDAMDDIVVAVETAMIKFPHIELHKSTPELIRITLVCAEQLRSITELLSNPLRKPTVDLRQVPIIVHATTVVTTMGKVKDMVMNLCVLIGNAANRHRLLEHLKELAASFQDYMSAVMGVFETDMSIAKILLNVRLRISDEMEHVTTVLVPMNQSVRETTKSLCQKHKLNATEYQLRLEDGQTVLRLDQPIGSVGSTALSLWRIDSEPRKSLLTRVKSWRSRKSPPQLGSMAALPVRPPSPSGNVAGVNLPSNNMQTLLAKVEESQKRIGLQLEEITTIAKQMEGREMKKLSVGNERSTFGKMRPRVSSLDDSKLTRITEEDVAAAAAMAAKKKTAKKKKKSVTADRELASFAERLTGAAAEWYGPLGRSVGSETTESVPQPRNPRDFRDSWYTEAEIEQRYKLHKKCKYLFRRVVADKLGPNDPQVAETTSYPRNRGDWKWQLPYFEHVPTPPPSSSHPNESENGNPSPGSLPPWDMSGCSKEQQAELKANIRRIDALEITRLRQANRRLMELDGETILFGVLGMALPKGINIHIEREQTREPSDASWTIEQEIYPTAAGAETKKWAEKGAPWNQMEEKLNSAALSIRSIEKLRQSRRKQVVAYLSQQRAESLSQLRFLGARSEATQQHQEQQQHQQQQQQQQESEEDPLTDAIETLQRLKRERAMALKTLQALEDPVTYLRHCYVAGKMTLFYELVKAHMLNHLVVYGAITLGTVTRNRDFLLQSPSVAKSLEATFIPTAVDGVYGPSYTLLRSDMYFDHECRRRVSRVNQFFDRIIRLNNLDTLNDMNLLDSRGFLCSLTAMAMTYRFCSQVALLTPASLYRFAHVAVGLMMHGLLCFGDKEFNRHLKADVPGLISFLVYNTCRQPEWASRPNLSLEDHFYFRLMTEEGSYFSALVLMRLSGVVTEDGTRYLPIGSERCIINQQYSEEGNNAYRRSTHSEIMFLCQLLMSDFEMARPPSQGPHLDTPARFKINGQSLLLTANERETELLQFLRLAKAFLTSHYVSIWDIVESQLAIL